jgi:iron complex outermembrane receptor protein
MHLSYWGVPAEELKVGNRRFNPLTYSNETDNFNQPHYQLHNRYQISENVLLSNTVYYIRGKGFYEQLKELEEPSDWFEYNIDTASITDTIGNLVRQQWVEKNQFGWNPRLDITHQRGRHSLGGSYYFFESDHYGQVAWAQNITVPLEPRYRYYQYFGTKHVGSVFGEERYQFTDQLNGQVTAQLKYQRYRFDQVKLGAFAGYDYSLDWLFFSPRVGLSYRPDRNWNLYANFAVASRTPADAAIYDANDPGILPSLEIIDTIFTPSGDTVIQFGEPTAKDERVYDLELGAEFRSSRYSGTLNLFWMDFHNEIIPYGGLNPNTGLPITINAERSVHAGAELTFAAKPAETVTLIGNFSWSYNRVKEFTALIDGFTVDFADKRIAGFPDYLSNLIADYNSGPFRATYRLRLVGRQYLELFNIEDLAIDPYLVSSVTLGYTIDDFLQMGRVTFRGSIRNLWDKKYETSGYGGNFAYQVGSDTVVDGWADYYPAAERSYFAQLQLELF